ncbi:MAG: SPOR domain-containing protein [Alcaligenaceae bacterium]|nr:SPOR domain-containing protein [Alcaligenaceae bacterium]
MSKSRKSREPAFRGSRIFMLLFGLILGLGIAAGVAWFVTQVPMPFTDKFSRADPTQPLPDLRQAPDPNQALSGRSEPVTPVPEAARQASATPQPGAAPSASLQDDIGALLTTLGAPPSSGPGTGATSAGNAPAASSPKPASPQVAAATPATPAPGTQTTYYLQAGAFRTEGDAQAMQARILMLGLQSTVQPVQVNGSTLHRVRVGPFKGIDEMNRSRATLSNAKIETTVVRP